MHEAGRITGKLDRIQITSWLPTRTKPLVRRTLRVG